MAIFLSLFFKTRIEQFAQYLILLFLAVMIVPKADAQENRESELFKTLKTKDSLLFNVGFNQCNIRQFEKQLSDDFEFYHDQAGIISSKAAFIASVRNNVCGLDYKARRVLTEESMEVYPLKKNGVVYGAIQTGLHSFFALEKGKLEYFTSRAKFTHVWKLSNGEWKFLRGLSYDHQDTLKPELPDFEDAVQIDRWLKKNNVPALAIGLIRNGQMQEIKVYGELDKGRPAAYNATFNVASLTKVVTAMLTLKLVSAGKWNLDEPLYHYWTDPDLKTDPRSTKITTRHILNQQSGFPNWRWEVKSGKLAFLSDPGSKYQYSGEGFEYLRHALEKKFSRPLDQLADELIFKPLGMTDTRYTWKNVSDTSRFAIPHDAQDNALPIYKNQKPNAADLVTTTIGDYGKFLVSALNGEGLTERVAADMVSHAVKTKENRYIGLCWFIYDQLGDGEYAISHGGDDKGSHSIFFLLPKSRRGIIIFTNSDNGPKLYADILRYYLKDMGQAIINIEMK